MPSLKRKRDSTLSSSPGKTQVTSRSRPSDPNACVELITTTRQGERASIFLALRKPVTIGRNPRCSYLLQDNVVSALHCTIQAVENGHDGLLVSCRDSSTNGLLVNGFKIRKTSAILVDGDVIEIPNSQLFTVHFLRQPTHYKSHMFEPTPPAAPLTKVVGKYNITSHSLGSGSFAIVHLAFDPVAYRQVACKTITSNHSHAPTSRERTKVMREVEILKSLNHRNINKVFDVILNDSWMHIFLELATGGDLFNYITAGGHPHFRLVEPEAKYLTYQLMNGLHYMHDMHVSHRGGPDLCVFLQSCLNHPVLQDLKPENVLLHSPGPFPRVTIADFGLARQKAYQETLNAVGTVPYMPPEAILALTDPNATYVGMPADCWSLGCCVYSMLSGSHPFDRGRLSLNLKTSPSLQSTTPREHRDDHSVKLRIMHGPMDFPDNVWKSLEVAKQFVLRFLVRNPATRMTIKGAFVSDWIAKDVIDLQKTYDIRMRNFD